MQDLSIYDYGNSYLTDGAREVRNFPTSLQHDFASSFYIIFDVPRSHCLMGIFDEPRVQYFSKSKKKW